MGANGRLSVVVTRRLPDRVQSRLAELFDVTLNETDKPMSRNALHKAMQTADAIVPTITDHIDADLIENVGDQLKLIAHYGSGTDNIDVTAAMARGIHVTNTPGVTTDDTADIAMTLILSVIRRVGEGIKVTQDENWTGWSPTAMLGGRIKGRKLGILGLGRIGRGIAERARAFGMDLHYHNRNQLRPETEADLGVTYWPSLNQMLAQIEILSINCPHTPATFHIMNASRLKLMKPNAVIINTSRGEVLDDNALTRMLRAGELAGAGLDVFANGHDINPRLKDLPNVILLPHMASATLEGREEMGERVILNLQSLANGHKPPDRVIAE